MFYWHILCCTGGVISANNCRSKDTTCQKKTFPKIPFLNNFAPLTSKLHSFLRVLRYLWHTCNHFFYKIYLLCGWPSLSVKCLNVWQILKKLPAGRLHFLWPIYNWQLANGDLKKNIGFGNLLNRYMNCDQPCGNRWLPLLRQLAS